MIHFCVIGVAQPAGSKKGFPIRRSNGKLGVAISDSNPKAKGWKQLVAIEAAKHANGKLLLGPLEVKMLFFAPRPKGHYRTGKHAGTLRDSCPLHPITRPDVLKQARAVEDALSKVLYADDSQIVREVLQKHYGTPARVEITITELP